MNTRTITDRAGNVWPVADPLSMGVEPLPAQVLALMARSLGCKGCVFWSEFAGINRGECRGGLPELPHYESQAVGSGLDHQFGTFPETPGHYWCRHFLPAPIEVAKDTAGGPTA